MHAAGKAEFEVPRGQTGSEEELDEPADEETCHTFSEVPHSA